MWFEMDDSFYADDTSLAKSYLHASDSSFSNPQNTGLKATLRRY